VTDDKELPSLKQHKSTRIITPAAVIEILKKLRCFGNGHVAGEETSDCPKRCGGRWSSPTDTKSSQATSWQAMGVL
jgi:hypothetical protein